LGEAETVLQNQLAQSPELRAAWAGRAKNAGPFLEKLRAASDYVGDEIAIVAIEGVEGPAFLAETKRDGFREFLNKEAPGMPVEMRPGLAVFGPSAPAVKAVLAALDAPTAFPATPFYARIAECYREG